MTVPTDGSEPVLELQAGYGCEERKRLATSFRLGYGLVGQCAKEKKRILLTEVPGDYVRINSGLGVATPLIIIVLPGWSRDHKALAAAEPSASRRDSPPP